MKSLFNSITVFIFAVILLLPGSGIIFGFGLISDTEFKESENRLRHEFPAPPASLQLLGRFNSKIESWFDDSYGGRHFMSAQYHQWHYKMGISSNPNKVVLGHDDWLFISRYPGVTSINVIEEHQGVDVFSSEEIEKQITAIQARSDWLKSQGIEFLIVFPPKKHIIYPEKLPYFFQNHGKITKVDQLLDALQEAGISTVDLRPPLLEAREFQPLYFKADPHWNEIGAYYAYQSIVDTLQSQLPTIHKVPLDSIHFKEGNTPAIDLAIAIHAQNYIKDFSYHASIDSAAEIDLSGHKGEAVSRSQMSICIARNDSIPNAPRALILRDSFVNYMTQYLDQSFSTCVYAPHGAYIPLNRDATGYLPMLVEEYTPDVVILIIHDSFISLPLP